ncbi:MAG: hypothetical protein QOD06_594 [Candidatus Binatota bacterium]|jgi:hypothetical protein|nr:hypothetical protein [Candidatus Binatota bacterium]
MDEEEPKGFQVRDRRRFTAEGESRPEGASPTEGQSPRGDEPRVPDEARENAVQPPRAAVESLEKRMDGSSGVEGPLPEITFTSFLMSLSTQALLCLGEMPEPFEEIPQEVDLPAARELIDIIGILKEKTRGNLDPAEARLIESILFDLRMRYVEKVRK